MVLNPYFWLLLLVLPLICWALPKSWRCGFIASASFAFIFTLAPFSVCALLGWTLAFYFLAPLTVEGKPLRGKIVTATILAILTFLAYFKYVPPLIQRFASGPTGHIIIPLGISYYTFKLIHYIVEVARGNITDRSLPRFLCYIFLFPIFTSGPIERFDLFMENRLSHLKLNDVSWGIRRLAFGLIKKFLLAEWILSRVLEKIGVSSGTLLTNLSTTPITKVWMFLTISYLYLYLDFSAYTDLALGGSRLLGFRIQENFNFPFIARSMGDFWKRWHRTLAGWCQNYVYMPILGLWRKPTVALFFSFAAIGLWHAGTLLRLLWGLYHATGVYIYMRWSKFYKKKKWKFFDTNPVGIGTAWILTQGYVILSMAFLFAGDYNLMGTIRVLAKLVGLGSLLV